MTATHEFVVPRSIPITFAIYLISLRQTEQVPERPPVGPLT
jgi:hypothetical protein